MYFKNETIATQHTHLYLEPELGPQEGTWLQQGCESRQTWLVVANKLKIGKNRLELDCEEQCDEVSNLGRLVAWIMFEFGIDHSDS